MRLYSSVIKLTNLRPVTLLGDGGQHAHGAFHAIIANVDPALATKLHDIKGRKPFTLSPLMGLPRRKETSEVFARHRQNAGEGLKTSEVYLREGWECWLRLTILDDTLFKTFIQYFMTSPPAPLLKGEGRFAEIRLGDAHFCVDEILTTPGSHPWAGYTSIEDLQKKLDQPPPQKLKFELFTVTSFKMKDENIEVTPTPKHVFGNLAGAWRQLTGEDHVRMIEEYAERNLVLVNDRLKTQSTTLHNKPQLGSVGEIEFTRKDQDDSLEARALNLLADLAFYTGLGRKTAQGMGMCSRVVA